jgi:hypothetical protein
MQPLEALVAPVLV